MLIFYFTTGLITVLFVRFTSLKANNKTSFYNQTNIVTKYFHCMFILQCPRPCDKTKKYKEDIS